MTGAAGRRTGRRGGRADTRTDILDAARELFAEQGYDATSLRAVARAAAVDPALVHHYFDGKPGLFAEAMAFPFDPTVRLPQLFDGPTDQLGERMARLYLEVWEGAAADRIGGLLRAAMTQDQAARMLREFVASTVVDALADRLEVDRPALRAGMCAAHVVGLGVLRGILGFPPLVEASDEDVVAMLAPALQLHLTGPVPPAP